MIYRRGLHIDIVVIVVAVGGVIFGVGGDDEDGVFVVLSAVLTFPLSHTPVTHLQD